MNETVATSPVWFCLHFPKLPVEVFARQQQDQPVVVVNRQRVAFMNHLASEQGIAVGSSMNTAFTINEQIVSFERDETRELARLQQLAQWALRFTPDVTIKPPCSLLLNVTGCLKLFKGRNSLKQQIIDGLNRLGFEVRIGVSSTPLAALSLAKMSLARHDPEKPETASPDAASPDAASQNISDVRAQLAPLPVSFLEIEPRILESLTQMGIAHCGQLFALPMDGLNRRYGVFFTDYLQRLTGDKPDPQKIIDEKPRFRSDITFMADVTNAQSLVFPMKRLLQELEDYLRGRQLQVSQFSFRMSHRDDKRSGGSKTFTVFLAEPDSDAQMFLMLSQLQLEKVNCLPEVDNLSLAANQFHTTQTRPGDLFEGTRFKTSDDSINKQQDETRAIRLINMMTARLGQQACFGLSLADDHRPERAWQAVSLAERRSGETLNAAQDIEANTRPLYLLPAPRRLNTQEGQPCMSGQLEILLGPERIDTGWWDDHVVARDYFIARHPSGAIYWIFRDLRDHDWHLHGIFS